MPDPFEALRTAPTPIEPDPAFAARLRARVARALTPDGGDEPMTLQQTPETADRLRLGDMIYLSLWVHDVQRAAEFFASVLGWSVAPDSGPYRQVSDLSMALGLSELRQVAEYLAEIGVPSPPPTWPTAHVAFVVDDLATAIERVRAAGGWAATPRQQPYGLVAACTDDQGMQFTLHEVPAGMPAPRTRDERQGDVAYLTFQVVDSARARAFFGNVLEMQFSPGRVADGWNVAEVVPMSGLSGGHQRATLVPMFRVDDIAAAVERVRAQGGEATDPDVQPYGVTSTCKDDQGMPFYLGQF
jgi:predicted enzyme related to lactoylglutathione lyase